MCGLNCGRVFHLIKNWGRPKHQYFRILLLCPMDSQQKLPQTDHKWRRKDDKLSCGQNRMRKSEEKYNTMPFPNIKKLRKQNCWTVFQSQKIMQIVVSFFCQKGNGHRFILGTCVIIAAMFSYGASVFGFRVLRAHCSFLYPVKISLAPKPQPLYIFLLTVSEHIAVRPA